MRTVGQILKETREAKFISLEEVEKTTKIRKELLAALETDDYSKLPPSTFVQGFIKNYAKYLNINPEKLLAIFRRDFETKNHPPRIMETFSSPISYPKFKITPSRALGLGLAMVILGFFLYLWIEYRQFIGAPALILNSPQNEQLVEIPVVVVEGKTDPEIKVTINDQEIGTDNAGNFRQELKLSEPINKITVKATGKFGQTATEERTVIVKQ